VEPKRLKKKVTRRMYRMTVIGDRHQVSNGIHLSDTAAAAGRAVSWTMYCNGNAVTDLFCSV